MLAVSSVDAATGQQREIIVSHADANQKLQLYRVNADGTDRRQLTHSTRGCLMPAWSPDGKQIVYVENNQSGTELRLADPDGTKSRVIVESGKNLVPSWLPDSQHIVWMKFKPGKSPSENSQLWIMNTATKQSRRLFSDTEQTKFSNSMPVVSPDGQFVAFISDRSGGFRVWVSKLDGSDARAISKPNAEIDELLKLPIEQKVPSWSPNGKWIAHWEGVEMTHMSKFTGKSNPQQDRAISATWRVWVVGRDGRNKREAGRGDDPNWSPDGFVTRSFPDPKRGGVNIMIETKSGWRELPIVPPRTTGFGRFTWKP